MVPVDATRLVLGEHDERGSGIDEFLQCRPALIEGLRVHAVDQAGCFERVGNVGRFGTFVLDDDHQHVVRVCVDEPPNQATAQTIAPMPTTARPQIVRSSV